MPVRTRFIVVALLGLVAGVTLVPVTARAVETPAAEASGKITPDKKAPDDKGPEKADPITKITKAFNYDHEDSDAVGLNGRLAVVVGSNGALAANDYVLFLNGRALLGLSGTFYDSEQKALVFALARNNTNAAVWTALLGSPTSLQVPVTVTLGQKPAGDQPPSATISGDKPVRFQLAVSTWWQLVIAVAVIVAAGFLVWRGARKSNALKDNLLPQLAPEQQPYSLGRWQMAFWFTLIFASFVLLYFVLGDSGVVSNQALVLMGISGATGGFAIAVDAAKNTPIDNTNAALRALGLNSYGDVVRVAQEIATRQKELKEMPRPAAGEDPAQAARRTRLQLEITDRENLLRTYREKIKPFVSQGWLKDVLTDINGSALHRVQVFCWTWMLGIVFVIGIWTTLAMPQFSDALLAIMGISGAGYVGFKYPEKQN